MKIEEIGTAKLFLGDFREVLPTLSGVESVVTDPPYGIGFGYNTHNDDRSEYPELMRTFVSECQRLTTGPCFVWQSMVNCGRWHEWFPEGFRIFAACKAFVQIRPVQVQYAWDPVIFWNVGSSKEKQSIRDWHLVKTPNFGAGRESIDHPCPRPIEQVLYILDGLKAETVLDPFMGSGTTGVACSQLGKKFVGVEIDEKYFSVACRRIEKAHAQRKLFEPNELQATQMELA